MVKITTKFVNRKLNRLHKWFIANNKTSIAGLGITSDDISM